MAAKRVGGHRPSEEPFNPNKHVTPGALKEIAKTTTKACVQKLNSGTTQLWLGITREKGKKWGDPITKDHEVTHGALSTPNFLKKGLPHSHRRKH